MRSDAWDDEDRELARSVSAREMSLASDIWLHPPRSLMDCERCGATLLPADVAEPAPPVDASLAVRLAWIREIAHIRTIALELTGETTIHHTSERCAAVRDGGGPGAAIGPA